MTSHGTPRGERFRYVDYELSPDGERLVCRYELDGRPFAETYELPGGDGTSAAADSAARLVFLLAGVSYYKATAPPVVDLGSHRLTPLELDFLRDFYLGGLGEYAYRLREEHGRRDLDLESLRFEAAVESRVAVDVAASSPAARPLIPFGGGIDSIVTVEGVREHADAAALFIWGPPGLPFDAIEAPAKVTGLPILRARRQVDPGLIADSRAGRYLNGHVPVTGILSAVSLLVAVLQGHDAVIMSNEWSASVGNVVDRGRDINHQWSKSDAFETAFRDVLRAALPGVAYFSWLRDRSEIWVAREFSRLTDYHATFRSCNRAFHLDPAGRLDHWCGRCDKCAFVDLVLAPFTPADQLAAVFGRTVEPLRSRDIDVLAQLWSLVALPMPYDDPAFVDWVGSDVLSHRARTTGLRSPEQRKPFECVGDVTECRAAVTAAAQRADRAESGPLRLLAAAVDRAGVAVPLGPLLGSMGAHHIPERYARADVVV